MKKYKNEIFKKLSLVYVSILFIPMMIIVFYNFKNVLNEQKNNLKKDNSYITLNIAEKISDSYSKLEKIKILIRDDIEFLEFLTNDKEKTAIDYIEFQRTFIRKYEKLSFLSSEVSDFKIFVDNKNLLAMQPTVQNSLPKGVSLKDSTTFVVENGKTYLYYFREIYFYPKSIYLGLKLDLENIIGKTNKNYYFSNGETLYNVNSTDKKEVIDKKYSFDEKNKLTFAENKKEMYFSYYFPFCNSYFINVIEKNNLNINMFSYSLSMFTLVSISLLAIYFISYFASLRLFKQLEHILSAVKEIQKGNLEVQIPISDKTEEFYVLTVQINSMTKRIKELINENVKKETKSKDFQIKALQSQINNHFIQNTLENIKMIAYINKDYKVSDAITNLGKILRYAMDWSKGHVTFKEEMEYIKRYIELFAIRTDYDITFRYYSDERILNTKLPKMIFQPFVENSIIHGIIPKNALGYIQIRGYYQNEKIVFEILDNGVGAKNIDNPLGTGIGLVNTKERLNLYFESQVSLDLKTIENKFTKITIKEM